jgi:hypothetical protein
MCVTMVSVCGGCLSTSVQRRDDEGTVAQSQCDTRRSRNVKRIKKETPMLQAQLEGQ